MFGFVIFIHVSSCFLLSLVILMQSGRGGGLTENFQAAESMFGVKTNSVLVRTTTVLASIFVITSLTLAFLSSQRNRSLISESLMKDVQRQAQEKNTVPVPAPKADVKTMPVVTQPTSKNASPAKPETQNQTNAAHP